MCFIWWWGQIEGDEAVVSWFLGDGITADDTVPTVIEALLLVSEVNI